VRCFTFWILFAREAGVFELHDRGVDLFEPLLVAVAGSYDLIDRVFELAAGRGDVVEIARKLLAALLPVLVRRVVVGVEEANAIADGVAGRRVFFLGQAGDVFHFEVVAVTASGHLHAWRKNLDGLHAVLGRGNVVELGFADKGDLLHVPGRLNQRVGVQLVAIFEDAADLDIGHAEDALYDAIAIGIHHFLVEGLARKRDHGSVAVDGSAFHVVDALQVLNVLHAHVGKFLLAGLGHDFDSCVDRFGVLSLVGVDLEVQNHGFGVRRPGIRSHL
jgi:hypothetical protein